MPVGDLLLESKEELRVAEIGLARGVDVKVKLVE